MVTSTSLLADLERADKHAADWSGEYNGENCDNCGRLRVELCENGLRRCEKCGWSPELCRHVSDSIY